MGFEILAADALATLTAHFTKKAVGILAEKTNEFYQKVKEKLSDDPDAEDALKRVEEQPTSKVRQAALKGVMTDRMEEDSSFAEEIQKMVEEMQKVPGSSNVIAYGQGAVAIGRDANAPIITGGGNNVIYDRGSGK